METSNASLKGFFSTTVGMKVLVAFSGAVMVGFVIAHLLGNLQIFLGAEAINRYAAFLQASSELLWPMRIFLLMMIAIHIKASIQLTRIGCAARPVPYVDKQYIKATLASRTMIYSGTLIFGFIVYHLLHFTFLRLHPQYSHLTDPQGRHDVYSMMVLSFQQPLICAAYIVPIFFLCAHLSHGISSMFQTLGLNSLRFRPVVTSGGSILAWMIFIGYSVIPLGCLLGWAKLPPGVHP